MRLGSDFVLGIYDTKIGAAHKRIKDMRAIYQSLEAAELPGGAMTMPARHLLTKEREKSLNEQEKAAMKGVEGRRQALWDEEVLHPRNI